MHGCYESKSGYLLKYICRNLHRDFKVKPFKCLSDRNEFGDNLIKISFYLVAGLRILSLKYGYIDVHL